jgi:hypothetical protein
VVRIRVREQDNVNSVYAERTQMRRDGRHGSGRGRPDVDKHRATLALDEGCITLADRKENNPVRRRANDSESRAGEKGCAGQSGRKWFG